MPTLERTRKGMKMYESEELYLQGYLEGRFEIEPAVPCDRSLPKGCSAFVPRFGAFDAHRRGLIDGQRQRYRR
jgi:hypothetical protein